jgi:hypothetical protein
MHEYQQHLARLNTEISEAQREASSRAVARLRERRDGVEDDIRKVQKGKGGMNARVGARMKERIEAVLSKQRDVLTTGLSVFAAVLSVTLTVVKFVALGG